MNALALVLLIAAGQSASLSQPQTTSTESQSAASQDELTPAEATDASWKLLQNGMADKSADRRAKAAHALGLMQHDAKAQEMAEKALRDINADVRVQAATALGQMDARSAQPRLKEALKDSELKVVVAAANSLYLFKDPAAYEIYYALLTGERKGPGLVKSQMDTLKDKKQLEKLIFEAGIGFVPFGGIGYQAYRTVTQNDSALVRVVAAEKLASDPDPKTTKALGQACSDKDWKVRLAVVDAIARRGDPSLLPSLTRLIYDSKDEVRFESAATILRLTTKPPVPPPAAPPAKKKRG